MEECKIINLYNLNETIAAPLFEGLTYPWEALPKIKAFIIQLGNTLPADKFNKIGEDVWIAKSAKVAAYRLYQRSGHRGRGSGDPPLCLYQRQQPSLEKEPW